MNISTMPISNTKRQIQSIRLTLSFFWSRLGKAFENIGHLFFHITTYKRRTGYVEFNVEEEMADGFVRYNVADEDRVWRMHTLGFRISNRWMVRDRQKITAMMIWQIKTAAQIDQGLNFHSVVLGSRHNQLEIMPFNITNLPPPDSQIKLNWFEALIVMIVDKLHEWFPNRDTTPRLTMQDAAKDIIIKQR